MLKFIKRLLALSPVVLLLFLFQLPSVKAFAADNTGLTLGVKYNTHVQNVGWQDYVYDGQFAGTSGQSLRLEGIHISLENPIPGMKIRYQTHVQNEGWQDWKYNGTQAGSVGKGERLEAIRIALEGQPVGYHIQYQVHVQNIGWQDWVQDGELSGTEGKGLRLEGIKIRIVKEGTSLYGKLGVTYKTHVQNVGWQDYVYDGQFSGTQGLAYRLEGINIALKNPVPGMRIKYQTHVQNIGWQGWKYDGDMAGTQGQGLRLEGIQIALEGAPAWYHVKYQVHVQNEGWQDWKQDGQSAGTVGKGLRLEGIRIVIVDKDQIVYSSYNISLSSFINKQMATEPAINIQNYSTKQWEWRYAQIQNNTPGYYVWQPQTNSDGSTSSVKNWTNSPWDYQNITNVVTTNLDPAKILNDPVSIYQFVRLSYVDGVTASQLNQLFSSNGVLANKGQVFIDAAKANNVNPIYLAAHAILESGNGTSTLAQGVYINGTKAYNLFGIQAVDSNPMNGANYAYDKGWTSVDKAIYGGASWIASGYINNSTYKQDTIYKMRWNPQRPGSHQYATDAEWARKQTTYIKKCFDMIQDAPIVFDVPVYQ
ncbi:glucosaminidase domain-containing protein [Clostridium sp. YIM B02505]|uniref:Glucosaminidase domain-containing protein n=1 Tax=Clostridium yunnanense TaxID=2800325 RepID=A0ABS1EX52_9CLOT|nr:glucosaminidase domain-containing protein [Clostridium yunnanense]MBK1813890.1 glucosaminidase domain-containing protein [Clostridium yunnanense]